MVRQRVISTSIASIGYSARQKVLEVEFLHGGVYRYSGVPASEHEALMGAPSKGRHVVQCIKDHYPVVRVKRGTR